MFKRFRKEKRAEEGTGSQEKLLQQINDRLERLEKELSSNSRGKLDYHITIEHVHLNHPVLENLTFQLDSLDIEEVSGALNLGNNFATRVEPKDKSQAQGTSRLKKPAADHGKMGQPASPQARYAADAPRPEDTASEGLRSLWDGHAGLRSGKFGIPVSDPVTAQPGTRRSGGEEAQDEKGLNPTPTGFKIRYPK